MDMLESVVEAWDDMDRVLEDRPELEKLAAIDKDTAEYLLEILKPFKESILYLETCQHPTLHAVWLHYMHLRKHLSELSLSRGTDDGRRLQTALLDVLNEKVLITWQHKAATFLHPSYKSMNFEDISFFEKKEVEKKIRDLAKEVHIVESESMQENASNDITGPPSKVRRSTIEDKLLESFCPKRSGLDDEVGRYMDEECQPMQAADLLSWWKEKRAAFPHLSAIARKFLAVPATSAASETIFSSAGRTVTDLRTRLNPETVRKIMFLHYND